LILALTALDIVERKRPRLVDIINSEEMVGQLTLSETDSVSFAISVLAKEPWGLLAVVDEGRKLVGLVSERDIIRAMAENGTGVVEWSVSRVMKRELSVATPDTNCTDTLLMMIEKRFRHMPVIDYDGTFIACVDALQVAHAKLAEMTESNRKLLRLMAVFTDEVTGVTSSDTVETIRAMFSEKGCVAVVVFDEQKAVGVITADELVKFVQKNRDL
jgi:CBS domain-containing protein